jgi:hypothetical protein
MRGAQEISCYEATANSLRWVVSRGVEKRGGWMCTSVCAGDEDGGLGWHCRGV